MGGVGSGRQASWYKKKVVEATPDLKISKIKKNLEPGQQHWEQKVHGKHCTINLTWTSCNYGGQRPWFVCPKCGRRAGVLYTPLTTTGLACRTCHRLTYTMSQENKLERCRLQNYRLCRRLGGRAETIAGTTLPPLKPKRMHWRTYDKICVRIADNDSKYNQIVLGEMQALLRRMNRLI